MVINMFNVIIGVIIGYILNFIINFAKRKQTPDYSELIKRCIEEANSNISKDGKKKHSN